MRQRKRDYSICVTVGTGCIRYIESGYGKDDVRTKVEREYTCHPYTITPLS